MGQLQALFEVQGMPLRALARARPEAQYLELAVRLSNGMAIRRKMIFNVADMLTKRSVPEHDCRHFIDFSGVDMVDRRRDGRSSKSTFDGEQLSPMSRQN